MPDFGVTAGRFALAVLVAAMVGGCSASEPPAAPVVLPGAPGDEPRVATSEDLARLDGAKPKEVEADYVRMMIRHHQQAVEMTALAGPRADNPKVRALAERIGGAQEPEIGAMRGWLATHHLPESEPHGHNPGTMPGMASTGQMAQLASSHGRDFDRLFLQLMTAHHQGAITMATDLLKQGLDEQVHAMAQDTLVTQTDEVATMSRLFPG